MIRQTAALFVDAYRELNARKLFWVVLGISLLVAGAFACVGLTDRGISLLGYEVPVPVFNRRVLPSDGFFYKFVFFYLGFSIWLTWAATILALISTASIIPDFVTSGAIELSLSKPIGRVRLFVTKYLTALLFVAIQVLLFTAAAFLVIGIRGKTWVPVIFTAIPLVLAMFSYLYVISALVGLLTRSAITALLAAGLFWFFIFVVQATEAGFLQQRVTEQVAAEIIQRDIEKLRSQLAESANGGEETEGDEDAATLQSRLGDAEARLQEAQRDAAWWRRAHGWVYALRTVLPKTSETMDLLERSLLTMGEMDQFTSGAEQQASRRAGFGQTVHGVRIPPRTLQRRVEAERRERSAANVLGTSLAFEAAVLALAAWIFARRDF